MGHALMENRNGLIVGAVTTTATGHAERWAALTLIEPHAATPQPVTLGADKGYDSADFVMALRDKAVTPHVAQHTSGRCSAIDEGTTGHPGYAISQRIRKRVEEAFGWAKTVAGLRKMQHAQGRLAIHPRNGRLRPCPATQIARPGCPMIPCAPITPRIKACLRPIRRAAKRAPHRYADYCGTQSALKSAFFSTLLD
jgi:hypothetical protein